MSFDFENAATAFIKEFRDTVTSALRLPNDVAAPDVVMNDEKAKLTATFHLPLCVPPPQGRTDPEPTVSQLYSLYLKITLSTASTKKHLAVFGSSYQVRLFNNPCIRFEYEKCKREKPAAHIHLSGIAGPLSTALMGNIATLAVGKVRARAGTASALMGFTQFVCAGIVSPLATNMLAMSIALTVAAGIATLVFRITARVDQRPQSS